MKKNIFFIGLLIIVSISAAYAFEAVSSGESGNSSSIPVMGIYNFPLFINLSEEISQEENYDIFSGNPNYFVTGYDKFGGFGKFLLGFGNIFLGLGSLIAGEWRDMLKLDLNYFLSAGMAVGGFFLCKTFLEQWPLTMIVPILGTIGDIIFISLGVALMPVGVYMFVRTIIDGFLYPYGLGSSPSSNRNIKENPLLNLSFNFVPLPNGKTATQVAYTIRY